MVICQQIFSILVLLIFPVEFPFQSASKSFFLGRRDPFGAAISVVAMYKQVSLCKDFCAKACCLKKST